MSIPDSTTPTHLFVHTVTRFRPTFSRDTAGSPKKTMDGGTSIVCKFQENNGDEMFRHGGDRTDYDAHFYCAPAVDVKTSDNVRTSDGRDWNVLAIIDQSSLSVVKKVLLKKLEVE